MAGAEHDACGTAEMADGDMRQVDLAGQKVLLARIGAQIYAVGATCPHAGGPLAEGVLCRGEVICPWHKAAFDVTTGARTEPPAWDNLPSYPVRIAGGRVLVTLTDDAERIDPAIVERPAEARVFAIVGSGAAGAAAAQTLRERGFGGRVLLISREDRLPYDRTLLSKYVLSGEHGGEKSPLQDAAFYARHRIERLNRTARAIDPVARRIHCENGDDIGYDAALVATGGSPRRLSVPGGDLPGVFVLRNPEDAAAIVAASAQARRVVVVGAGFIGMEAAASLCERGLDVTVVAPQSAPFEKQLGADVGNVFRRLHESKGVAFRLGHDVARIEPKATGLTVVLETGEHVATDLVVVGLGIRPATDILGDMAHEEDGSVRVDASMRIGPDLYAAGDIATYPLRGDGPPVRVEHWRVAAQQGRIAALNMMGAATRYDAVPVFWTIHFMKRLDYVGHAAEWDDIVYDGDLTKPEFLALYVKDGRVAALAGFDRDRQIAAAIGLMTERGNWSADDLLRSLPAPD